MDHVRCVSWWWDVGTREPQALDQGRHRGGTPREPGDASKQTALFCVEVSGFLTGGDHPGERPVVVGLGGLACLQLDDLHQLIDDGPGQLWRGSRVDEVHQMPHMSGGGAHSQPGRSGIAAPTHVLNHPLGSQRLVQLVGVCPRHCLEHCICPSGQQDAHGTPVDASGKAAENRDLRPDHAGHVVQDLGRHFRMGALLHRLDAKRMRLTIVVWRRTEAPETVRRPGRAVGSVTSARSDRRLVCPSRCQERDCYVLLMRRLSIVPAVVAATVLTLCSAAAGQAVGGVQIESPQTQSGVASGQRLTVSGRGCDGGSEVTVFIDDRPLGAGRAAGDGTFAVPVTVPVVVSVGVEEASESTVAVACGRLRASTVVAVSAIGSDVPTGDGGVSRLAATGPSAVVLVQALVATSMVSLGAAAVGCSRAISRT